MTLANAIHYIGYMQGEKINVNFCGKCLKSTGITQNKLTQTEINVVLLVVDLIENL